MYEFQNTKTFLVKDTLQIGQKKFLSLKKLKTQFHGNMLLVILKVKKLLEHFMGKKNLGFRIEFRIEKVIKKKR